MFTQSLLTTFCCWKKRACPSFVYILMEHLNQKQPTKDLFGSQSQVIVHHCKEVTEAGAWILKLEDVIPQSQVAERNKCTHVVFLWLLLYSYMVQGSLPRELYHLQFAGSSHINHSPHTHTDIPIDQHDTDTSSIKGLFINDYRLWQVDIES